jgi:hypothetical protein
MLREKAVDYQNQRLFRFVNLRFIELRDCSL